nr:hypothetical protein [Desulfurococcales archaeon]
MSGKKAGGERNGLRPSALAQKALERVRGERIEIEEKVRCVREALGPNRGFLVAVEGIDGAGLSTTAEAVAHALNMLLGRRVAFYTKEPTYGPVGFIIWQTLTGVYREVPRHPAFMSLLFAADRLWHLLEEPVNGDTYRGLIACLQAGHIVVSDRYKYSSLAYQSVPHRLGDGRVIPGAGREWLKLVNAYAPPPHLLVIL